MADHATSPNIRFRARVGLGFRRRVARIEQGFLVLHRT